MLRTWTVAGILAPVVTIGVAAATWHRVSGAFFFADDFVHLYDLVSCSRTAFLTQVWAGHIIAAPRFAMLLLFDIFGPDPRPYFWSMLLTHLLNVALLYGVIMRFTGNTLLACASAIWWGTSPVLAGTLDWYSVYGQVLLTTVVLVVLSGLASSVAAGHPLSARRALGWAALLAVGSASFASGLGIAAAFPLVAWIVVPPGERPGRSFAILSGVVAGILLAYASVRMLVPDVVPSEWLRLEADADSLNRGFALLANLAAFGVNALVAPPFTRDSATTLATAIVGVVIVAGWWASDSAKRRAQLGLWLLVLATYTTIVVGRLPFIALIKVSPVEAATWQRYHYLATSLIAVALAAALAGVWHLGGWPRRGVALVVVAWTIVRLVVLGVQPVEIDLHQDARVDADAALAAIRREIAATPLGGVARITNRRLDFGRFNRLPGWVALFAIMEPHDVVDGRTVRFVVSEQEWAAAQARGGRMTALVELTAADVAASRR